MRSIPDILKEFICKDAKGEFLRLQDSEGNFHDIRVANDIFSVYNAENGQFMGMSANKTIDVYLDAREFANNSHDIEYTLRRSAIPGETFVFYNNIGAFICFVNDANNYISITFADLITIGIPDSFSVVPNQETSSIDILFATNLPDGTIIDYQVANEFCPPWCTGSVGSVAVSNSTFTITLSINYDLYLTYVESGNVDDICYVFRIWNHSDQNHKVLCTIKVEEQIG